MNLEQAGLIQLIREILKEEFDLLSIKPLHGGALHRMWFVKTKNNAYAIKEINEYISKKSTFPDSYERAENIAFRFSEVGIPVIAALQFDGQYVQCINERYYLIYPYIEGEVIPPEHIKINQLPIIGELFARMHGVELIQEDKQGVHYDLFDDAHWEMLIDKLSNKSMEKLAPVMRKWNKQFKESILQLNKNLIMTHRDMHSLNILWDHEKNPHIIDWESAGLMNPLLEVIGYAMEWGGVILDAHDFNKTVVVLESYKKAINKQFTQEEIEQAFYGWIGNCILGWTEFNLRRMLGETGDNKEEIDIGKNIIINKMIPCIEYLQTNETTLLKKIIEEMRKV